MYACIDDGSIVVTKTLCCVRTLVLYQQANLCTVAILHNAAFLICKLWLVIRFPF